MTFTIAVFAFTNITLKSMEASAVGKHRHTPRKRDGQLNKPFLNFYFEPTEKDFKDHVNRMINYNWVPENAVFVIDTGVSM